MQSSVKSGTASESISRTVPAGSYYASVYPKNNGQYNAGNCYTLRIALGTAARSTIQEISTNEIRMDLHPNPANQILNISIGGYNNEKIIEVFDLMGKVVIAERTTRNNAALRISTLPGGLYLIKVTARDGTVLSRDKFMKE
ncbi:MAG: T9SS type A sorting domain-containing protein [Flavisolibacter sp.]|nr:T9SS type A sorting domain-containing protein [Flavisolibacter sp.]